MAISASDEYVRLCETQLALIAQGLGASLGVVYLTEDLTDDAIANLCPVVALPDRVRDWSAERLLTWLTDGGREGSESSRLALPSQGDRGQRSVRPVARRDAVEDAFPTPETLKLPSHQAILPLGYNAMVLGALVVARSDRPWQPAERNQLEQIAQTLAIARLLDQRSQWMTQQIRRQHQLQVQQREMLGNLLHQFRNPMTAMRTFGKLLWRRLLPEDRNRTLANSIVRESDRLQELLEQFDQVIQRGQALDWSPEESEGPTWLQRTELEAARLPSWNALTGDTLDIQPCQISDILRPLLLSAGAIAQDRQIELNVEIADGLPPVAADARALREVLNNILDNALKYTPSHGQVWVWVGDRQEAAEGDRQGVTIADTGPGIPAADLEHIFERHYRGVQAQTAIPGTGLGLAIARDLMEQMGGHLLAYSPRAAWQPHCSHPHPLPASAPGTVMVVWLREWTAA
jgi:signal transduction histidine kinase